MELSSNEVTHISSLSCGFKLLRQIFAFPQLDAFNCLCSVVTKGSKKVSSPSRRIRKNGALEIFHKLAVLVKVIKPSTKIDENILSKVFIEEVIFVKALTLLSPRWKIFTFDELTHLSSIIDQDEDGAISWIDFYLFCRRVEENLRLSTSKNTEQSLHVLFDDLSTIPFSDIEDQEISNLPLFLHQHLRDICTSARVRNAHPLTQLFSFIPPHQRQNPIEEASMLRLLSSLGVEVIAGTSDAADAVGAPPEESINALLDDTLKYLRIHASEVSVRSAAQDKNADDAVRIWEAITNLETELRTVHGQETGISSTLNRSVESDHNATLDRSVGLGNDGFLNSSVESDPSALTLPSIAPSLNVSTASEMFDPLQQTSVSLLSADRDIYYFPKGAVVASPYRTPADNVLRASLGDASSIHSASMYSTRSVGRKPLPKSYPSLDIIRSPIRRQKNDNVNVYDHVTLSWQPTVLTNKYNERFQYPAELTEAAKMNAIYFQEEY